METALDGAGGLVGLTATGAVVGGPVGGSAKKTDGATDSFPEGVKTGTDVAFSSHAL